MVRLLTRDIAKIPIKEVYKRLGISEKEAKRTEKDVYSIIRLVASTQGLEIPKKDMPKLIFQPGESSAYDRGSNNIYLAVKSIGKGETYAAEAGHFIRSYVTGKLLKSQRGAGLDELKVEEFLDRASYRIAKEKVVGTEFEPLFKGREVDYSNKEGRKKLAKMIKDARAIYNEETKIGTDFSIGNAKSEVMHARTHTSYAFADQYSADELLAEKDLFSLSDKNLKRRFFHKKKSGIERKVSAVFLILIPIFLIYFFGVNLAGFVLFEKVFFGLFFSLFLILGFFKIKRTLF